MPATVDLTRGPLSLGDAPANVQPESWDPNVDRYLPLDSFPITATLDRMKQGKKVDSKIHHWWTKPLNPLSGVVDDVYTNAGLTIVYAGATLAAGNSVYLKPTTASETAVMNGKVGMQMILHSLTLGARLVVLVTSIEPEGLNVRFCVKTLQTDTSDVLLQTDITWALLGRSMPERHELGESISEQVSPRYNYMGSDMEEFGATNDKLNEATRLNTNIKDDEEMDALLRLTPRREFNALEAVRHLGTSTEGPSYYAGGLRFFLNEHESANVINWKTDTTYSAATDTVLAGTLPFLRRVFKQSRIWIRPGATMQLHLSATNIELISNCVLNAGTYNIDYGTNKFGIDVAYLRGLGRVVELVENAFFEHYAPFLNTGYLLIPELMSRHEPIDNATGGLPRSKGLIKIPWSGAKPGQINGDNYKSWQTGAYLCHETFEFRKEAAFFIIDNLGLDK